jgi:hypothetical protein
MILGAWAAACAGKSQADGASGPSGEQSTSTGTDGGQATGGRPTSTTADGGQTTGGQLTSTTVDGGPPTATSAGGQSTDGQATSTSAGGGEAGQSSSTGGDGGEGGHSTIPDPDPSIHPNDVGHIPQSCGGNMWSKDGETFLDCTVDGEHEAHPDCVIVDCTAHGDTEAICVFSNHCYCSQGFRCEDAAWESSECESRNGCVPVD